MSGTAVLADPLGKSGMTDSVWKGDAAMDIIITFGKGDA
jgi:hypothetical protein